MHRDCRKVQNVVSYFLFTEHKRPSPVLLILTVTRSTLAATLCAESK